MARITPAEAQAYFNRWQLVKEIELGELRGTSMDTKLRQLSALVASRSLLRIPRQTSLPFGSRSASSLVP